MSNGRPTDLVNPPSLPAFLTLIVSHRSDDCPFAQGFLWLVGALEFDNIDWSNSARCASVRDYFSRLIAT